ncbi:hypothetical protein [Streptosporangium carneum]|uniref:Uncharacterized protein n=1 Tax=Streptosporangium carneum TaxID=47481 RepID=A0A9W6MIF2_9ACTN|nr:hypothetical protein [Streptosporangium carneum]GLK15326.1 hypothetical protein GCM10017600_87390 [Streptosporangium carneum]
MFAAVLTVGVLAFYGVSASEQALFAAYAVLGLAFPGVLLVRALYGGGRTLAEEVALGLALGYAVELFAYLAARALGFPLLVLAWPVTVYALFLSVPRLRRHFRGGARLVRAPVWSSWSLALLFAYLLLWSAASFFRTHALTWPGLGTASVDMPFHLALAGELKHHVPPMTPMVAGEPLFYHWFVYAHLASASWVTGLEPLVLLFRLAMLPMLAAFVVLCAMTGRRVTGSCAGGALAAAATVFVAVPSLYLGSNGAFTWGGVADLAWTSPTQTFGSLMFAPILLLLVDLLEHRRRDARRWLLLGIFLVAVTGAKATYLPLAGAGLVVVAAAETVRRRRPSWPVLAALGMTAACFLYAQLVLFGRGSQATTVSPLSYMRTSWQELTGLGVGAEPPPASVLGITLVYLLCWGVTWCGALGLLSRPRLLVRPATALMLGVGAAGLGTMFLLGHPARSQLFFLWGAYPCLATVTVYGVVVLLRRARVSRGAVVSAVCAGVLAAYLVPVLCGVGVPLRPGQPDTLLYRPYVALLAVAVPVVAFLVVRRGAVRALALVVAACAALGLPADLHARVLSTVGDLVGVGDGVSPTAGAAAPQAVPSGAAETGRWLRANSDPGDLLATNAHCLWTDGPRCDSRHFWLSALSERRVLVEGWMYTATNLARWRPGLAPEHLPFWDEERIRLNDTAFRAPSADVIRRLRDVYGVRWLVEEARSGANPGIGDFARLRFRSGDYAVYRIPDDSLT